MSSGRAFLTCLRSRWFIRCVLSLILLTTLVHCSTRTEAPALPPGVRKMHQHVELAGRRVSLTLYKPAKDDNAPLVVVAHGFTRSKRYMAGWGAELAGQGFLAAVPTQPAFANHELNARVLAELVKKLREKRRVAVMGFSMGGLTTLLAATKTPVDAWVGLDPVDMDGTGKTAAANLKIPCAVLRAEREAFNMNGNATGIIAALPGPKFTLQVRDGTHLDAEWPTDLLGQIACGFVDEQRQSLFHLYAVAFLRSTLMHDTAATQVLAGAANDEALTH